MSKEGRWTQVEPSRLLVGAEGGLIEPPKRIPWKRVAIVAGVAIGAYLLFGDGGPAHEAPAHAEHAG
jgi:hypothetical protein